MIGRRLSSQRVKPDFGSYVECPATSQALPLADADRGVVQEGVRHRVQILGRRAAADAARGVIVRAVARAEPAAIFAEKARIVRRQRNATQVRANGAHDEILRLARRAVLLLQSALVGG